MLGGAIQMASGASEKIREAACDCAVARAGTRAQESTLAALPQLMEMRVMQERARAGFRTPAVAMLTHLAAGRLKR
jgi:hypothetical protein